MDRSTKIERYRKLLAGLGIFVAILVGKLFYIQIINDKYKISAANNSMYYETVNAPRGIIYDRNGKIMVENRSSYDILCTPRETRAFDTLELARILGITPEFVRNKMQEYRQYRTRIGFQSVTFLRQVEMENYVQFAELEYRFPGFKGVVRTTRTYPLNAGGNLLGYVSEVDADYIDRHPDYKPGDYAGKTGLEAAKEDLLRGTKGYKIYVRNSRGRILSSFRDGEFDKNAIPGKDITTTIDSDLQLYGQALMKGKVGSLVAIEPSTGEILAMVSSPGIDVEMLSDIGKYYPQISKDKNRPMFNRTVMASYPPGSVFKLVNGLIGLQEGVLEPYYTYPCYLGYYYSSTRKLGCHNHRSPLNLEEAIMMSCNAYFCFVLKNILENRKYPSLEKAFDRWREYVLSFGFGQKLGSDFPGELNGNIPSSDFYNKRYGRGRWRFPTIVSLSIGQGEIGATPLQIANLAAIVANRGYYYIPHIIKASESVELESKYSEKNYTMVDTTLFDSTISGMWRAVNDLGAGGTANSAYVRGLDICGKTGTAQNPHGKDNSVFLCFAPKDNPKIAVAAYVENVGWGGTWACPIASLLVEKYLNGEIGEYRKSLENRILTTSFIQ
ncbi:MAG: penicillin-binding protein 2 [Bacteroidales bacterium]|nr:penicillin-binding protein 2 [Candidatus Cryptobacteroides fimicaballi]